MNNLNTSLHLAWNPGCKARKMRTIILLLLCLGLTISSFAQKEEFVPNYNEQLVPDYDLPDPLTTFEGKAIRNKAEWEQYGRPEILEFYQDQVFGWIPGALKASSWTVFEAQEGVMDGKANRKQVSISFEKGDRTLDFHLLIYLPEQNPKAPLFLGYNFYGNHTITNDTSVWIPEAWSPNNKGFRITQNKQTAKSRGVRAYRWDIEHIISAGFGLATIYYGEVDPDRNNFEDGIHPFFYSSSQTEPADNEWGSISAWVWGLSRAMDYLQTDTDIDSEKIVVFGHSRLGKAALWAGASDQRFAAAISNNSGCGGAALSKREFGEALVRINTQFPHWFCRNFRQYNKNERALPVDQHELIALMAPRPVYVASAQEDQWADPKGEFLSAYHAGPVYQLYGIEGISSPTMPQVNSPIHGTVAYHIRTGKHDVTDYDWEQYTKWAQEQLID